MLLCTPITVEESDCVIEEENDTLIEFNEESLSSALENGQISVDQAIWMHEHGINWQIVVVRRCLVSGLDPLRPSTTLVNVHHTAKATLV